jgi:hypothetical protein
MSLLITQFISCHPELMSQALRHAGNLLKTTPQGQRV